MSLHDRAGYESWFDRMTRDEQVQALIDRETLRQEVCARGLVVPTGAEDWVARAVRAANISKNYMRQGQNLRDVLAKHSAVLDLIPEIKDALERFDRGTLYVECQNCMGRKGFTDANGTQQCFVCLGTGRSHHPLSGRDAELLNMRLAAPSDAGNREGV